ncbi:conserved hypothetical protein [Paraburkholderia piptadeniae]|uniref:Uncharacterized protein n=1 Tax=Paraburkholderia piptadeniae TaxID=1701573 RepID=A0A1N7SSN0_9BURK|nr:hypothetical protein [Paraburkholderia piptadeniae]SIT50469.1 conserved hypothetical protein [Paraburkholderia piptadeniae]
MTTKIDRAVHANQLIRVIASHGRRFFYCVPTDRYARIELDPRGRVWFIDDYSAKPIYTHNYGNWRGFTHGGTLRDLVDDMRDYIMTGKRIGSWKITRPREDGSNTWGYDKESAEAVRNAAFLLPIVDADHIRGHA